ncbi:MAG: glycoside hydrolase family 9 protein, partial [Rhizobacter sp.]
VSKYLSHLSYANFMNPQQTPQVVWNLIEGRSRAEAGTSWFDERIVDEALHGADFLVRMQHPDGYLYMTVFDRWSKDVRQRRVCSYTTQQGHLFATYQAGWRQGAGSAIAALARAAVALPRDGEFTRAAYLAAARRGFTHLEQHNREYLDDGRENLIDDYCALLGASELFGATAEAAQRDAALRRVERLLARQHPDGWFWADDAHTRSWFHAAEAGLPCIALMRFLALVDPGHAAVRRALRHALQHQLSISARGDGNPFGYPRQHVRMPGREPRTAFFIPHENESGYWWQGENARLASLAAASLAAAHVFGADDAAFAAALREHAERALAWIFGFNPFDACMMQGRGHNPPRYEPGYWNAPGGVCNGITAGLDDEDDIDFRMPWQTVPAHSWRWTEQWIPHGAWLFLALAST